MKGAASPIQHAFSSISNEKRLVKKKGSILIKNGLPQERDPQVCPQALAPMNLAYYHTKKTSISDSCGASSLLSSHSQYLPNHGWWYAQAPEHLHSNWWDELLCLAHNQGQQRKALEQELENYIILLDLCNVTTECFTEPRPESRRWTLLLKEETTRLFVPSSSLMHALWRRRRSSSRRWTARLLLTLKDTVWSSCLLKLGRPLCWCSNWHYICCRRILRCRDIQASGVSYPRLSTMELCVRSSQALEWGILGLERGIKTFCRKVIQSRVFSSEYSAWR